MGVVLDLIASMVVRGAIIYIVITMNIRLHEMMYEKAQYAIVKQNTATMADIFKNDLRYVGYDVTTGNAFITIGSDQVKFAGDIDDNGVLDTLHYYVGPLSEMASTPNPNDRIMYRHRNGGAPMEIGHGVTTFSLKYHDINGSITADPALVRSLWVKIVMQGSDQIKQFYPTSILETDFFPPNI